MEFECCFCKGSIKETGVDPVGVSIIFAESKEQETGRGQFFFAHYACLKSKLHADATDYLLAATRDA